MFFGMFARFAHALVTAPMESVASTDNLNAGRPLTVRTTRFGIEIRSGSVPAQASSSVPARGGEAALASREREAGHNDVKVAQSEQTLPFLASIRYIHRPHRGAAFKKRGAVVERARRGQEASGERTAHHSGVNLWKDEHPKRQSRLFTGGRPG